MPVSLTPVKGLGTAGDTIHGGFGKRMVPVVPFDIGKGDDYIVEQVILFVRLGLVAETGCYLIVSKPLAGKVVIPVAIACLLWLDASARLEATQGGCLFGLTGGDLSAPSANALPYFQRPNLVTLTTEAPRPVVFSGYRYA